MFSQVSVILSTGGVHGLGHAWWGACVAGGCVMGACVVGGGGVRGRREGHCSGRYASYWNVFL